MSFSKRTDAREFAAIGLALVQANDASELSRLEEKLVDAQWLGEWVDFLRTAYSPDLPADLLALLPSELVERREAAFAAHAAHSFEETPHRLTAPIESIANSGGGLESLFRQGRLALSTLCDILLHPAALIDLHVALYTSESLHWIARVKKTLRTAGERADEKSDSH